MLSYLVSYDLRGKRDYDSLYKALQAYNLWARIHESTWYIATDESAISVRDNLLKHVDDDDRIFVAKYGGEAAWRGTICSTDWLKEHL